MTKAMDLANKLANLFAKSVGLTAGEAGFARGNIEADLIGGIRNKFHNGLFEIAAQTLGAAVTIAAGTTSLVVDRWLVFNGTDKPLTLSRAELSIGTKMARTVPRYYLNINFASAPTAGRVIFFQRVESVRTLAGSLSTLSAFFSAGPAGPHPCAGFYEQRFGLNGSAGNLEANGDFNVIGGNQPWARYDTLITPPGINAKIIGTDNNDNLTVGWRWEMRAAGDYRIALPSLVEGDARRDVDCFAERDRAHERMLCQRFARRVGGGALGRWNGPTRAEMFVQWGTPMRSAPVYLSLLSPQFTLYNVGLAGGEVAGTSLASSGLINNLSGGSVVTIDITGRLDGNVPAAGNMAGAPSDWLLLTSEFP